MELLTNIIIGYLKHNKRLVVPKLGAFIVKQPDGTIIFSELMRNDDGVLRSLLVAYGCNELAANGIIDRFVFEVRHNISQGTSYAIPNLGEFVAGENNTIRFKHKREPKVFGGTIKPPVERFDDEKLKWQRIQRIRQQQSENITGHSTHRRLKSSTAISTTTQRKRDDDDLELGKPDKYLRGLKYENRKGRNNDEERFGGNERQMRNKGGRTLFLILVAIVLSIAGWFTWQWIEGDNNANIKPTTPSTERSVESLPKIEQTDSLKDASAVEQARQSEAGEPISQEATDEQPAESPKRVFYSPLVIDTRAAIEAKKD